MLQQFKRGTASQISKYVGLVGQPLWNTDTNRLTVGDGKTPGGVPIDGSSAFYIATHPMVYLGTVTDEAAMLALAGVQVDNWVIRADTRQAWVYKGGDTTALTSWALLPNYTANSLAELLSAEKTERIGSDFDIESKIDSLSATVVFTLGDLDTFIDSISAQVQAYIPQVDALDTNLDGTSASLLQVQSNIIALSAMLVNVTPPQATTTTAGVVELATDIECVAGIDDQKAVTPSSLHHALESLAISLPPPPPPPITTTVIMADTGSIYAYNTTGYYKVLNVTTDEYTVKPSGTYFDIPNTGSYKIYNCDSSGMLQIGEISNLVLTKCSHVDYMSSNIKFVYFGTCPDLISPPTLSPSVTGVAFTQCNNLRDLSDISENVLYVSASFCSSLSGIPALPPNIKELTLSTTPEIKALPSLPNSMVKLYLLVTGVQTMPTLPSALDYLTVSSSPVSALPTLPSTLTYLSCGGTHITTIPNLPANLKTFYCGANNLLTNLPTLSHTSLSAFRCYDNNAINQIPALPPTLKNFYCNDTFLTQLPSLPVGLLQLECKWTGLTALPPLPQSINFLDCSGNNLPVSELDGAIADLAVTTYPSGSANISYNPGTAACNVTPAVNHGWTVYAAYN